MPHREMMSPIDLIRSHANGLGMVGVALLAVSEVIGHGVATDLLQVIAAALTSAGIAVSAALWLFNLILDKKLNAFERLNITPFYETTKVADDRYDRLIEDLKQLKDGHFKILDKIEERSHRR